MNVWLVSPKAIARHIVAILLVQKYPILEHSCETDLLLQPALLLMHFIHNADTSYERTQVD